MSSLTHDTVLERLAELDLHLDGGHRVVIDLGTRKVECGRHALAVLAEFSTPRKLSAALAALQETVTGSEDWRELTATLVWLHEHGVLHDESRERPPPRRPPAGYDTAPIHIRMLNDRARTAGFLAAIRAVVRPGDVVVDLGTGTGVLAVAAARAGASRVYAIEQSSIADSAAALFEASGLADRITLLRAKSTEVELPERGDVLVSEMIGDEPLGERLLNVTADAVKRLLEPDARLIPSAIEVFGLPVTVPRQKLAENVFQQETLQEWRSRYGIDFAALANAARNRPRRFFINPHKSREWPALSTGVPLVEVDLKAIPGLVFRRSVPVTADASGELNGVLVYFEAELAPGIRLSTAPASVTADNHWYSPVWILADGLPLRAGDRLKLTYSHNAPDAADGVVALREVAR